MIIPQNQWTTNSCSQNQDFYEHPYVCTSWAERYACFLIKKWPLWAAQKWLFHSTHIFLRLRHEKNVFCGINFCDVGILWKKFGIYFRDSNVSTNFFQPRLKKEDTIYMGIINMALLSRNLLCKNIYTMSSLMWSN